jgi:hypothetical protein
MVDKLWYDWQHKYPQNFWSYFGGANSVFGTKQYADYPNGTPPFLNVGSPVFLPVFLIAYSTV